MIKIEDYIFLRMIGYPYSGRVNGDDIIIQEKVILKIILMTQ